MEPEHAQVVGKMSEIAIENSITPSAGKEQPRHWWDKLLRRRNNEVSNSQSQQQSTTAGRPPGPPATEIELNQPVYNSQGRGDVPTGSAPTEFTPSATLHPDR